MYLIYILGHTGAFMGNKYQRNSWSCVWLMLNLMECVQHAEEWLDRGYDEIVASRVICRNCPVHVLPCPWEFPAKNFVILRPLPPHPTPVVSLMTNPRGRPGALFMACFGKKEWKKEGSSWFCSFCKYQVVTIWGTVSWTLSLTSSYLHRPSVFFALTTEALSKTACSPQTSLLLQELVTKCKETWLNIKLYLPFDSKGENLCLFQSSKICFRC